MLLLLSRIALLPFAILHPGAASGNEYNEGVNAYCTVAQKQIAQLSEDIRTAPEKCNQMYHSHPRWKAQCIANIPRWSQEAIELIRRNVPSLALCRLDYGSLTPYMRRSSNLTPFSAPEAIRNPKVDEQTEEGEKKSIEERMNNEQREFVALFKASAKVSTGFDRLEATVNATLKTRDSLKNPAAVVRGTGFGRVLSKASPTSIAEQVYDEYLEKGSEAAIESAKDVQLQTLKIRVIEMCELNRPMLRKGDGDVVDAIRSYARSVRVNNCP